MPLRRFLPLFLAALIVAGETAMPPPALAFGGAGHGGPGFGGPGFGGFGWRGFGWRNWGWGWRGFAWNWRYGVPYGTRFSNAPPYPTRFNNYGPFPLRFNNYGPLGPNGPYGRNSAGWVSTYPYYAGFTSGGCVRFRHLVDTPIGLQWAVTPVCGGY